MMPPTQYIVEGIIKLITTTEAREICRVEGKPINIKTLMRMLVQEGIEAEQTLPQGTRLYDEAKIVRLAKKMAKKRIPGHPLL